MTSTNGAECRRLDRYPILYVDDEPENLRVFELSFKNEFKIMTATCAEDGLRILSENPVAVVVSDQKMLGMQGTVFLSHVRELAPSTVRILTTAFGDVETLSHAINNGAIYRYIPKPWEPDDVEQTLRGAVRLYQQSSERERVLARLECISDLAILLAKGTGEVDTAAATLKLLTDRLGFDGATWLSADSKGECLKIAARTPEVDSLIGQQIDRDGAPEFIEKLRRGEAQILSQDHFDIYEPGVKEWVAQLTADNIIIVPIRPEGRLAAALAVDNGRGSSPTSKADRALLEGIAGVSALALHAEAERDPPSAGGGQGVDWLIALGGLSSCLMRELAVPVRELRDAVPETNARLLDGVDDLRAAVDTLAMLGQGPAHLIPRHPCDLAQEVENVCSELTGQARSREVDVELVLDPDTPKVPILPEPFRLLTRLLLQCSFQQLPNGGRVRVSVAPSPSGPRHGVALEISDNGKGIDFEEIEDVCHVETSTTVRITSTGHSLSGCQYLVAALGGELEVSSGDGDGKRVRVWFASAQAQTDPTTHAWSVS